MTTAGGVCMNEAAAARRVTLVGALVNALNGVVKVFVGLWANSQALIADGIHSFSDLFSDLLVLGASHFGRQRPDRSHPYGHDRYETLATLLLGAILIAVAGALVWDSLGRLLEPDELVVPGAAALLVALASIASKEWIYHWTRRIGRRIGSRLLEANAWHHRTDSLSSVVVFIAVSGALLGFPWLDQLAAALVGLMVARVGIRLIWDSLQELVDTALPAEETRRIRDTALSVSGVRDVHELRTRSMGSRTLLDVHLQVAPELSVSEGHAIGTRVCHALRERFEHISDITFHIDPEDDADEQAAASRPLLPPRPEVLATLDARWRHLPDYRSPAHITLHYLDHRVAVDLFYAREDLDVTALEPLARQLRQATRDLDWLGEVKVWIGSSA